MKHPPPPQMLAQHLRQVAKLLDTQPTHNRTRAQNGTCHCPVCRAQLLAARGFPTNTAGDSRGASDSSSTEQAALTSSQHAGLDQRLTLALRAIWTAGLDIQHAMATITAHAPDDDPLPAGSGECQRCGHFCNPRQRGPNDRLRSGWCRTCHRQWIAAGRPDRTSFNNAA